MEKSTDFRTYTPCDLEITHKGQTVKLWVLKPTQISTDRVLTAQYWLKMYNEQGVIGSSFYSTVRNAMETIMRMSDRQNVTENFNTAREIWYNLALINEDLVHTKDRDYNYIKVGSLFCVLENEELNHPNDGGIYTDMITEKKMDLLENHDVYSFFLSVGLEFMKHLVPTLQGISPKTLQKNQILAKKLIQIKIDKLQTLGILTSNDY